jgi:ferritin-like metal-binding protein YciE
LLPFAELLGDKEGAVLLQATLQEEEETDKEFTRGKFRMAPF